MKIFQSGTKTNFVDDNNTILGWDMQDDCCEIFGWYFAAKPTGYTADQPSLEVDPGDLDEWYFDTTYFQELNSNPNDEGGTVVFRITNGFDERFLHLYNHHNGYYSHGFQLEVGGEVIRTDYL